MGRSVLLHMGGTYLMKGCLSDTASSFIPYIYENNEKKYQ